MAVFVSASDENSGKTRDGDFFFGGWIAPEDDWSRFFAPAWQERVLDGPPPIPYLHMTEIRSPKWREQFGLSRMGASDRVDEALSVIDTMGSLYPFAIDVNAGYFLQEMTEQKVIVASGGVKTLEPDYICFIAYSYAVVKYLEAKHPDVEKVHFIVERNGDITKHIQEFHSHFAINLSLRGDEHLADMVGELIPAGKDRIPLQAADVLCWHMGRSRNPKSMDDDDLRRYNILAGRKGKRIILANDIIKGLKDAFDKYKPSER